MTFYVREWKQKKTFLACASGETAWLRCFVFSQINVRVTNRSQDRRVCRKEWKGRYMMRIAGKRSVAVREAGVERGDRRDEERVVRQRQEASRGSVDQRKEGFL